MKDKFVVSTIVAAVVLFFAPVPSHAGDDTVVVPRDSQSLEIDIDQLLANDEGKPGASHVFIAFSQPSHGALIRNGMVLEYTPSTLSEAGFDHFRYTRGSGDQLTTENVYLVADLRSTPWLVYDGEEPPSSGGGWVPGTTFLRLPTDNGNHEIVVTYGGAQPTLLTTHILGDPGPAGGHAGMALDPGGTPITPPYPGPLYLPEGEGVLITSGSDASDQTIIEVWLHWTGVSWAVEARTLDESCPTGVECTDPNWVSTGQVPFPFGPHHLSLDWWMASQEGAQEGGLLLRIDGEVVAEITDLANHEYSRLLYWTVGDPSPPAGTLGAILFDDIEYWVSHSLPVYPPLSGDGFEDGTVSNWQLPPTTVTSGGGVTVTQAAAIRGLYGLEVTSCGNPAFVMDDSPSAERFHRVRFRIRAVPAYWPQSDVVTVLEAESGGRDDRSPFRVQLRRRDRQSNQVEVRASARSGGVWRNTPWFTHNNSYDIGIEVAWWAATKLYMANGGLRLWIDNPIAINATHSLSDLDNTDDSVAQLNFGLLGPQDLSCGTLHFDDFATVN